MESKNAEVDVSVTKWEQGDVALLQKYAQEKSLSEVSKILGRSRQAVESKAQELGIRYQKKGERHHNATRSDVEVENAMILWLLGYSQREISAETGVPSGTINSWAQGITRADINWERINKEINERLRRRKSQASQRITDTTD